ncbi:unnamed protein product [Protopolystoma xenopodis]|uniref:Uncharacterized protein n=1 Tax=Protopolystoma xenopodis TaxID=117903 RepID=A0A448X0L8_9PLAT|nr:unnamed protein product [Protopolystoma xenopodis]
MRSWFEVLAHKFRQTNSTDQNLTDRQYRLIWRVLANQIGAFCRFESGNRDNDAGDHGCHDNVEFIRTEVWTSLKHELESACRPSEWASGETKFNALFWLQVARQLAASGGQRGEFVKVVSSCLDPVTPVPVKVSAISAISGLPCGEQERVNCRQMIFSF